VKYGMSIGSSTLEIQPGDWVHLHNMKSDYIPSHTRDSRERR
jgi:(2R)-sulfolactate sulfo-lyase subunit alpha